MELRRASARGGGPVIRAILAIMAAILAAVLVGALLAVGALHPGDPDD